MAYKSRKAPRRAKSTRRASARRSYSASRRSGGARRSTARRSSGARTIRIVVEQAPSSAVARPPLFTAQAPLPRKAAF